MSFRAVSHALAALVDLALPATCAACRAVGAAPLCPTCLVECDRAGWADGPRRSAPNPCPPTLPPVFATARYDGALSLAVAAYKDDDRRDLAPLLGDLLARALDAALERVVHRPPAGEGGVVVVPVPSSAPARRRRGDSPLTALARRAATGYSPGEVVIREVLRPVRAVADQAGLGADERRRNLHGSMVVPASRAASVRHRTCVVVDDVMTTGATLAEASRALRAAGCGALHGAVVCATPRRHGPVGQFPASSG